MYAVVGARLETHDINEIMTDRPTDQPTDGQPGRHIGKSLTSNKKKIDFSNIPAGGL